MTFTRDGIPRKHVFHAPRKLAREAASRVMEGAEICSTFDRFGTLIARARLRQRPTIQPASDEEFEVQFARATDDMWKAVDALVAAEKKNPFKHLHVKPDAEKAWERFDKALRLAAETGENVPNCQGKSDLYSDYDDDSIPTAEEAYEMCAGCPLAALCGAYAEEERPAWGVWSGSVFIAGEVVSK